MANEFITPEGHTAFLAKKLFDGMGKIYWGAVAYIEKGGGGPAGNHTHSDNHIFIVVDGEVEIFLEDTPHAVKGLNVFCRRYGSPFHLESWRDYGKGD